MHKRKDDAFREQIADLIDINPDALLADGLEGAYLGYTVNFHHKHVAVYDYERCIQVLIDRDGMDYDGADEFLQFNTLDAYVGEHGPLFVNVTRTSPHHSFYHGIPDHPGDPGEPGPVGSTEA